MDLISTEFQSRGYPLEFSQVIMRMMSSDIHGYLPADKVLEAIEKLLYGDNHESNLNLIKNTIPEKELSGTSLNLEEIKANFSENGDDRSNLILNHNSHTDIHDITASQIIRKYPYINPAPNVNISQIYPILDPSQQNRNIIQGPQENHNIRLSAHEEACEKCRSENSANLVTLGCGHSYHSDQFKEEITKNIKSAIAFKSIQCKFCSYSLTIEEIINFKDFDHDTRFKTYQLYFNCVLVHCPACNTQNNFPMLSSSLNPIFKRCSNCDLLFCSYCDRVGAHRLSCDRYEEDKKKKIVNHI